MTLKKISSNDDITLELVCFLPTFTQSRDEVGNSIKGAITYRPTFCAELAVNSMEFHNAGQYGIKPECLLVFDSEEYGGETSVKYNDVVYNVYRTYLRKDGLIELYCNKKAGV